MQGAMRNASFISLAQKDTWQLRADAVNNVPCTHQKHQVMQTRERSSQLKD